MMIYIKFMVTKHQLAIYLMIYDFNILHWKNLRVILLMANQLDFFPDDKSTAIFSNDESHSNSNDDERTSIYTDDNSTRFSDDDDSSWDFDGYESAGNIVNDESAGDLFVDDSFDISSMVELY